MPVFGQTGTPAASLTGTETLSVLQGGVLKDTTTQAIADLAAPGGAAATNLSGAGDASTYTIASDTGTDATIPAATNAAAGVMSAADKAKLDGLSTGATITTKTASATLALTDGNWIRMDVAMANTLTVPSDSSVNFPVGTSINVRQVGAGQTTIVAGSGVTITTPETLKLRKQHATVVLVKEAADAWAIAGDLEAAP